jgi:hypothetical protein
MIEGYLKLKVKSLENLIYQIKQFIELNDLIIWKEEETNVNIILTISNLKKYSLEPLSEIPTGPLKEVITINIKLININEMMVNFKVKGYGHYCEWNKEEPLNEFLIEFSNRYPVLDFNVHISQKLEEGCKNKLHDIEYIIHNKRQEIRPTAPSR